MLRMPPNINHPHIMVWNRYMSIQLECKAFSTTIFLVFDHLFRLLYELARLQRGTS